MYIYKITNKINGKIYIGQSSKAPEDSINYYGSGKLIKLAIHKYGLESFKKEIVINVDTREEADYYEIFYIDLYKPEYNISSGGNGGNLGPIVNKKISEAVKALWADPNSMYNSIEYRQLLSEVRTGRKVSNKTKLLISNSLKNSTAFKRYCNKPKTQKTRQKISKSVIQSRKDNVDGWHDKFLTKMKSSEHRKKLSDSHIGQIPWNKGRTGVYTKKQIQRMSEAQLNRIVDPITESKRRKKIGDAFRGKVLTKGHKQKISNSKKNKSKKELKRLAKISADRMKLRHLDGTGGNYTKLKCLETGKIYNSIKEYIELHSISMYIFNKNYKNIKVKLA